MLNPAQVGYLAKSHTRRNKTGKADALLLALYARERPADESNWARFPDSPYCKKT